MTQNGDLSETQQRALAMMLAGVSSEQIGQTVGKSTRTIDRWKASEKFREVLRTAREKAESSLIESHADRIARLGSKAMDVVESCLCDSSQPMRLRLQAASLAGKWADFETPESKASHQLLALLVALRGQISEKAYEEIEVGIALHLNRSPS